MLTDIYHVLCHYATHGFYVNTSMIMQFYHVLCHYIIMYINIYVYEKSHHVILNITYHENSLDAMKKLMKNHTM